MKRILISLILSVFTCIGGFSMISPEARLNIINKSQVKIPAIVESVKTIQNHRGNRTLLVKLNGLYNNSNKKFEVKCYNYKHTFPWDNPKVGGTVYYSPQKGQRVFVTIDCDKEEITSMVIMNTEFENKLLKAPEKLKFNYYGAYFED